MSKQTYTTGQVLTSAEMTTLQANDYNQTVSAKVASYTLVASDAGTRITMSNASATTITVNTSLFTAGDTLIITNIGAGVCTVTAGTATVSTGGSLALAQYDSGTLYFTSTGVSIWNGANPGDITGVTASTGLSGGGTSGTVSLSIDSTVATLTGTQTLTNKTLTSPALTTPTISTLTTNGDVLYGTGSGALSRLGIGSSAQVLTVASGIPSWATPAGGGGGTVFINKTNFSAISSQSVNSVFTSTYDNYLLLITTTTGGGGDVDLRLRTGSDDSTSNYNSQSLYATNTTLGGARETSQTFMRLGTNSDSSLLNVTLGQPNVAAISTYTSFSGTNTTLPTVNLRAGSLNTSTQYTGFTLLFGGSTTGSVSVYGMVIA